MLLNFQSFIKMLFINESISSPYGHYFASCGMDKTARVWAVDQYQSLRLYPDHLSDVECLCFHPNSNYIATGSSDRNVRIFDLANLTDNPQVRQYTGHKVFFLIL
jgi:transcription initiation factor TFIID subunit 5